MPPKKLESSSDWSAFSEPTASVHWVPSMSIEVSPQVPGPQMCAWPV